MASSPQFITTPRLEMVNVSAANTATDGTGGVTTLLAAATNGTRVLEIRAKCAVTSTAALINVFVSYDSGLTWKIIDSLIVPAVTVSTSVGGAVAFASYVNLVLPAGASLGVTTTVAQSTNVVAMGGDL